MLKDDILFLQTCKISLDDSVGAPHGDDTVVRSTNNQSTGVITINTNSTPR
jgi:hypothetical protein